MSILRSELQVALQELYRLAQESVDHYKDTAQFVDDEAATRLFIRIADEREAFARQLASAIRDTDDLPAAPDADREAGEQLVHRLHALFTADQTQDVLEQRLKAELELAQQLDSNRSAAPEDVYQRLHDTFTRHVDDTIALLDGPRLHPDR